MNANRVIACAGHLKGAPNTTIHASGFDGRAWDNILYAQPTIAEQAAGSYVLFFFPKRHDSSCDTSEKAVDPHLFLSNPADEKFALINQFGR